MNFKVVLFSIPAIIASGIGLVYLFQESIIFQTNRLEKDYKFHFNQTFQEFHIITNDGEQLNALLFSTSNPPKGLILYFHGNADNLQRWGDYAVDFTSLGFDILMVDYRGYGKSSGIPSEQALYKDSDVIWSWARKKFEYKKWVIYGRSLGSAVASHLAVEANPNLLILETPFDELRQGIPSFVLPFSLKYKFSNKDFLPNIDSPIVIIHGTNDWIVSEASAKRLIPFLKPGDEFVSIPGGGHNNLRKYDLFHKTLARAFSETNIQPDF